MRDYVRFVWRENINACFSQAFCCLRNNRRTHLSSGLWLLRLNSFIQFPVWSINKTRMRVKRLTDHWREGWCMFPCVRLNLRMHKYFPPRFGSICSAWGPFSRWCFMMHVIRSWSESLRGRNACRPGEATKGSFLSYISVTLGWMQPLRLS